MNNTKDCKYGLFSHLLSECMMGNKCMCKEAPEQPSPTIEPEELFKIIKGSVGQIFWDNIQMSADGKAIEGNPAVHKIAEYIVHNFLPILPESDSAIVDAFFNGAARMKGKVDQLEDQLTAAKTCWEAETKWRKDLEEKIESLKDWIHSH